MFTGESLNAYGSWKSERDPHVNSKFAVLMVRPPNLLGCVRLDTWYIKRMHAVVNKFMYTEI